MYGLRYSNIRIKDQQLNLNMGIILKIDQFLPLRIIKKGRPIIIKLPSFNKKVFRFIYPFLRKYPDLGKSLF